MDGTRPLLEPAAGAVPFLRCRRDFLGVPIDCLSFAETLAAVETAIRERRLLHHVCLNVAKFVAMRSDRALDLDMRSADLVSVDGAGILWAARLFGIAVPERVAGIDLFTALMARCAASGYRPYLLGATPDVLEAAVAALRRRHPALDFAGWHHGYFGTEEESAIVDAIRNSKADCLFIGMPSPRKERFLNGHRDRLGVPFIMGVGGSFDVVAGKVHRAPPALRRLGLEWAWRMVQEPRRLGPRYARSNLAFAALVARALIARH